VALRARRHRVQAPGLTRFRPRIFRHGRFPFWHLHRGRREIVFEGEEHSGADVRNLIAVKNRRPKNQSEPEQTKFDAFVLRCKNNKWIALILIILVILTGIAGFTDAIDKIRNFIAPTPTPVLPSQSLINSPGSMQAGRDIVINSNASPPPVVVLQVVQTEPLDFRQKHEDVEILVGGNIFGLPPVPHGVIAKKDIGRAYMGVGTHEKPSGIQLVATDEQIFFNIRFAPLFGMPPLNLENNELSGLPSNWDCNHSKRAIEVVDDKLVPIFQIFYKDDTHIVFNGAITFTNGAVFVAEGKGLRVEGNANLSQEEFFRHVEALGIKKVFKYPAWQHPGEYADQ
jgi:hypothetical protein